MPDNVSLNCVAYFIFIIELLGVMLIIRATPRTEYDMCMDAIFEIWSHDENWRFYY